MTIRFWGVRGSLPVPLTPEQIRRKIAAVMQRVQPKDLVSQESRERFLGRLPEELFGCIGGNTTCLEVDQGGPAAIVVDAGTGIRELGLDIDRRLARVKSFHIFLTHFHWDHLQGFPFFRPAFSPDTTITFYSPVAGFEQNVRAQMQAPFFPVDVSVCAADIRFQQLSGDSMEVDDVAVSWKPMKHPGGSFAYRFGSAGRTAVFASDTEITNQDFERTRINSSFFRGVDLLILDSQYTLGEALEKYDWGHTSSSMAVDFAATWG